MSFLIDDILKRDATHLEPEKINSERKECQSTVNNSILQKTLLNRQNFPYYRSISEPHAGNVSWCPSDRVYHSPDYYEIYKTKAMSFPNIYTRNPMWPHYTTIPLNFFPQFCHLSKRKGGQVRFTANQTDALEKRFTSHKYLSPEDRKLLADSLKLTDRQVKTWFQNRRAKWRRCNSVSSAEISSTKFEENKLNNNLFKKSNELFVKSHD